MDVMEIMNSHDADQLSANVKKIYSKDNNDEINTDKLSFIKMISPSSNTKIPIYRIVLNGEVIKKNNKLIIEYQCIVCSKLNIVSANTIIRKMNKNMPRCHHCVNKDPVKTEKQSKFMENNARDIINGLYELKLSETISISDQLILDKISFNEMDDDFKDNYWRKYLDEIEFSRIKNRIVSFQNGKFTNIYDFEYYPVRKINNQTRFNPVLYSKNNDTLEKIMYIEWVCDVCNGKFIGRDLYTQKNRYKILCNSCSFTNDTFKLRNFKNIIDENILYQSKYELKFIKFCNENSIIVNDGPKLSYTWNNVDRKYVVDFMIKKINIIIELKDNHHWHNDQIDNGKWEARKNAAEMAVEKEIYDEYIVIFPKNYIQMTKYIVEKYHSN